MKTFRMLFFIKPTSVSHYCEVFSVNDATDRCSPLGLLLANMVSNLSQQTKTTRSKLFVLWNFKISVHFPCLKFLKHFLFLKLWKHENEIVLFFRLSWKMTNSLGLQTNNHKPVIKPAAGLIRRVNEPLQ